ncbi:MAG: hypothetical protein C0425_09400, partial [Chlorobiaceae bacterium]|nr:hypothetical protein [Chlorobiaceae bacterium]
EGLNWDGLGTLVSGVRRLAVISPLQRTTITFSLPSNQNVSLKIYNIMGEVVATLIDGFHKAGSFDVEFNASNLASGIYFYTLQSDNFSSTKKKDFRKIVFN